MNFGDVFGVEGAAEGVDIDRAHTGPAGAFYIIDGVIPHVHAVMTAHTHAGGGPAENFGIRLVQILVARDHAEIHQRAQSADVQLPILQHGGAVGDNPQQIALAPQGFERIRRVGEQGGVFGKPELEFPIDIADLGERPASPIARTGTENNRYN